MRCKDPPAQRNGKVPIQYNAWIVVAESGKDENIFLRCQLIVERPPLHIRLKIMTQGNDTKPPKTNKN